MSPVSFFAAIRLPALPTAFSSAFWRTVQLLTMTSSASSSPDAFSCPAAMSNDSTASESRTFIWHPYVCMWNFISRLAGEIIP